MTTAADPPAHVYTLSVQETDHPVTITVDVQSGKSLSVEKSTTIGGQGIVKLDGGQLLSPGVAVAGGGQLSGNGTVQGALVVGTAGGAGSSNAMLSPGSTTAPNGHLDVVGSYTQTATGTLAVDIHGTGTGQFDSISVSGSVSPGGALVIDASGLAPPTPGSANPQFPILSAGTLTSGTFSSVTTINSPGVLFIPIYRQAGGLASGTLEGGSDTITSAAGVALEEVLDLPGDMNFDGKFDDADKFLFALALADPTAYYYHPLRDHGAIIGYPPTKHGDLNDNGYVDFGDIRLFAKKFSGHGSGAEYQAVLASIEADLRSLVPEPSTTALSCVAIVSLVASQRRRHYFCSGNRSLVTIND